MSDASLQIAEDLARIRAGGGGYFHQSADLLRVTGADRVRFLNSQLTCDVKTLAAGATVPGFLVTAKGRVEALALVTALPDAIELLLPAGLGAPMAARLRKYVIVDRVEVAEVEVACVALVGATDVQVPEGASRLVDAAGLRYLLAPPEAIAMALGALHARGWTEVNPGAGEQLRIEAGIARFGGDFGPENFPQETGWDAAISYTKGCYLGQEVVARIHYRGGVQRHLRGMRLASPVVVPAALRWEGQEVGILRSVTPLPVDGVWLGLAIVHKKAEPGATLSVAAAGTPAVGAELVLLPFMAAR
jgi:folate-binding protein YgfZ